MDEKQVLKPRKKRAYTKSTTPEEIAEIQSKYPSIPREKREEVIDLPVWVRMALVEYETLDLDYKAVAKKYNRSPKTLGQYAISPAGKAWRAQIREFATDPVKMSEVMLRASATNVTLQYLMAMQTAIDAQDYREIGVMSRDILDRLGVTKQNKGTQSKPTIVINLGSGVSLEAPMIESSYEVSTEGEDYALVEE